MAGRTSQNRKCESSSRIGRVIDDAIARRTNNNPVSKLSDLERIADMKALAFSCEP